MIFKNSKDKNLNKNLGKSQRYTAFTLAEVLITLAIIGVVAGMTIPTLMNNIQDRQFREAFKKEYSTLTQAINQVYADEGTTYNLEEYPDYNYMPRYFCKLQKRLKIVESGIICPEDEDEIPANIGLWPTTGKYYWHEDDQWKAKNGSLMKSNPGYHSLSMVLADGAFVKFNCVNEFMVDVNGKKGPNTVGRDIFDFFLLPDGKNKPSFWGMNDGCAGGSYTTVVDETTYVSDCKDSTGTGWGCSALTILGE